MEHPKRTWARCLKDLRESVPAYLMILPTIAVFAVFLYIPFFNAISISLYEYNGLGPLTNFVGMDNFLTVLADRKFYSALFNTFKLIGCDLVVSIIIGFLLAYILYRGIPGGRFFNAALFIPYLISMVVVGSIWRILYDPAIGPINQLLEMVGLDNFAKAWLARPDTALGAITVTWIWRTIPFNMLIIYANILTMPKDFLEAAEIDGANTWHKLRSIIVPYLAPTFSTLAILTMTNDLRAFDMVWIMTQGGPGGASEVITSYIYRKAFSTNNFGTATAASLLMMLLMVLLTIGFNLMRSRKERRE